MAQRESDRPNGNFDEPERGRDWERGSHAFEDRSHAWREIRDTAYAGVPGAAGWDARFGREPDYWRYG